MSDSPLRFGELQRSVSGITQKELTRHLREFEKLDLLTRKIYPEVPPRVEYRITDYGKTLQVPLAELARWSMTYGERLFAARRQLRRK
jgi:DNA-binding HxlR family transcriptional regulator